MVQKIAPLTYFFNIICIISKIFFSFLCEQVESKTTDGKSTVKTDKNTKVDVRTEE